MEAPDEVVVRGKEVVYVVGYTEAPGYYKIGYTTDLDSRLKTLEWAGDTVHADMAGLELPESDHPFADWGYAQVERGGGRVPAA